MGPQTREQKETLDDRKEIRGAEIWLERRGALQSVEFV